MKVCIYARVSSDKQEEKNQVPDCLAFCKEHGWKDPEIIQEKISAFKNPDRDSLKKLEKYDHVVVWAFDRLQRNRKKFMELMRYYSMRGTKIHSVNEVWIEEIHKIPSPWNDIMVELLLHILGWMAEEESKKKSERVRKSMVKAPGKLTKSFRGKKWGRKIKKVDMKRLQSCLKAGSLRKIATMYNKDLPKKEQISYVKVMGVLKKSLMKFTPNNQELNGENKKED